jgi:type IV pilus assembly protein PilB
MLASNSKKVRLGDILVGQGVITEEQLSVSLKALREAGMRLGEYLASRGIVSDADIAGALHGQLGVEMADLRGVRPPPEILATLSGEQLRQLSVFPAGFDPENPDTLLLAMSDPLDQNALDDISFVTNRRTVPRIATQSEIQGAIDRYFGAEEAANAAERYAREHADETPAAGAAESDEDAIASAPMVQLVRSLIEQATRQRASDIHIDALEKQLRVRYRVDGVLTEKMLYDISILPAVATRIKIMSGMDISEKRKPQDGRMTAIADRQEYDIRVSSLPTFFGEKLVLRLQLASGMTRQIADLGMRPDELPLLKKMLSKPNGLLLVTGPTGSGKTTTLYTALGVLNKPDVNIITVEDPVEASVPGINQVQVDTRAELTFASALRSVLRQDPDIIMIGEVRDGETAAIAVRASITGHLVLSTLHTNSAAAAAARLIDMGVESFLLADALVGIVAQRLVRRLCLSCRAPRSATPEEKRMLGLPPEEELELYDAVGCPRCGETGYYGRVGVYEIMPVTPAVRRLISDKASTEAITTQAVKEGMSTLDRSASRNVADGITTLSEIMKIAVND